MATSEPRVPAALPKPTERRETRRGLWIIIAIVSVVTAALLILPGNPAAELGYGKDGPTRDAARTRRCAEA